MTEQAVIFCGGRGKRLNSLTKIKPKPMVKIQGKPFLLHIILQLKKQGIKKFLLLTGYKSKIIKDYFKDGKKYDIKIEYSHGANQWKTGKRIFNAKNKLDSKFLFCYCDNYINYNLKKSIRNFKGFDVLFTISSKQKGNLEVKSDNKILNYDDSRRNSKCSFVEIGYCLFKKKLLKVIKKSENNDLSLYFNKFIRQFKVSTQKIKTYQSTSTIKRYKLTNLFFAGGKIILLDRDGIINKRAPKGKYVTDVSQIQYIKKNINLFKALSYFNFKFIVISNQAGVGRKIMSRKSLNEINNKIIKDFKKEGISILKVYYCPHHWIKNCDCRKPKPLMVNRAMIEFNIKSNQTIFIGDDLRDYQTAKNSKCYYIHKTQEIKKGSENLIGNLNDMNIIKEQILKFYKVI